MINQIGNVHIINYIENAQYDVALLKKTFEKFGCIVEVYEHLTADRLYTVVERLVAADFSAYNYVVVAVLDNRNPDEALLRTFFEGNIREHCMECAAESNWSYCKHPMKNNKVYDIRINYGLLTYIRTNRTLCKKKLIYLRHNNRNVLDPAVMESFYNTNNDHGKLYDVNLYELKSVGPGRRLQNHWPMPYSDVSPFVKAFCQHFDPIKLNMREVCQQMYKDYEDFANSLDSRYMKPLGNAFL